MMYPTAPSSQPCSQCSLQTKSSAESTGSLHSVQKGVSQFYAFYVILSTYTKYPLDTFLSDDIFSHIYVCYVTLCIVLSALNFLIDAQMAMHRISLRDLANFLHPLLMEEDFSLLHDIQVMPTNQVNHTMDLDGVVLLSRYNT